MEALFLRVLNMSFAASYVILATLLARLLLKRAPRRYSYALWSATAFRLCCPVSFPAVFSLFGLLRLSQKRAALEFVPENLGRMSQPEIHTGIPVLNSALADTLPAATPAASANPMQVWTYIGAIVWLTGIALLLGYALFGALRLRLRLRTATLLEPGVYQSESVRSPFLFGVFRPKIYLPYGLDEDAMQMVLAHERFHLRRCDPLVRLFAWLLLTLHWFNPLVWLAFFCMSRDMETRCDEHVLASGSAKRYSLCLLSVASGRRFPAPSPLAFGETGVKARIRHALRWKQPRRWMALTALALSVLVLLSCAANPRQTGHDGSYRAGKALQHVIFMSYWPEDGDFLGLEEFTLSGNTLHLVRQLDDSDLGRGEYNCEARRSNQDRDTLAQTLCLLLGAEPESGPFPESTVSLFLHELTIPEYDDPADMEVYEFYGEWKWEKPTGYTYTKLRPDYVLCFFRGEPLWFGTSIGIFRLEKD